MVINKILTIFALFFTNVLFENEQVFNETQKLKPTDVTEGDRFGYSIDISVNLAVIGSYGDDDNGSDAGSAYIFSLSDDVWSQASKFLASDGGVEHLFGKSSGISGDFAVV